MIREMTVRGFSPSTHKAYLAGVIGMVRYYRCAPDQITEEEVRAYIAHLLQDRHLSWSSCNQVVNALRFLYRVTLGRERCGFQVPAPRQPQRLPAILSREEVWRLLRAPSNAKHRLLLATIYAGGLRVSEAIRLKVADIDADRMTIRVEQGKGAKDRYVPLSPRLLEQMLEYWEENPRGAWLFPSRNERRPVHITTAQRIYMDAKASAGIAKNGGIHALRHAYATHLLEAGSDVTTVQHLLGHRYVTTTMRYFHISQGRLTAARSPLDLPDPTRR